MEPSITRIGDDPSSPRPRNAREVLVELCEVLAWAQCLADVNVAAGLALEALKQLPVDPTAPIAAVISLGAS